MHLSITQALTVISLMAAPAGRPQPPTVPRERKDPMTRAIAAPPPSAAARDYPRHIGHHDLLAALRSDDVQTAALMVATAAATVAWVLLDTQEIEWPGDVIVAAALAAWVPNVAMLVHHTSQAEIDAAVEHGRIFGYRDGYSDGFVDCVTLQSPEGTG
jgi:hypothetical protein